MSPKWKWLISTVCYRPLIPTGGFGPQLFMEDLSDRELARDLEENLAAKWFGGFTLSAPTPACRLFTRVRNRIGPTRLAQLFSTMREQLKTAGLMSEVCTFMDATHLIAKSTL
jgi:transposase, IS5 family